MEIYVEISFISTFYFFFWFSNNFIRCVDFACIAASNTAIDNVTHRIFNRDLLYSCADFVVEIEEKSSHNCGFYYDLMMISDNGLLFWPPCV